MKHQVCTIWGMLPLCFSPAGKRHVATGRDAGVASTPASVPVVMSLFKRPQPQRGCGNKTLIPPAWNSYDLKPV